MININEKNYSKVDNWNAAFAVNDLEKISEVEQIFIIN